jgi:multiple sugar transport system substrate-binding protein
LAYILFAVAFVTTVTAWLAARADKLGPTKALGTTALATFIVGAGLWLFGDTVSYWYGDKEEALRLSYWGSYREHEMWKEIIAAFRKQNPDIPIKQEYITDRYEGKIQQQLLADEAPDVILFQDEPIPRFAATGKFEVLDPYCAREDLGLNLNRDYWKTAVESFQYEGKQYGIPVWGGDCLVIYNREAFRRAGVPEPPDQWTVDDFLRTCEALTADTDGDGRLDSYGFLIPGWVYWLPFHYAFGADYLDRTRTKWALWGPEAEASFQFWQDLRFKYHVSPHRDELTEGGNVAFMTGRVGMFISGPWAMPTLNEAKVDYDVAHIPSGPGGHGTRVTWDSLMMFGGSQKKEWAWRFIHFVASLPAQNIIARYQRSVPALKAARDAYVSENPKVHAERFIDAFAYSRIQPITKHWQLMGREAGSEIDQMLNNDQTVADTLRNIIANEHLRKVFQMPDADATK